MMSSSTGNFALPTLDTIRSTTISTHPTPWLTVSEAAGRARCGAKLIYKEVRAGRLKAARVGGRRELRLLPEWVDAWLTAATTVQ
jgi:excisionase family DNA binding protein